MNYHEAYTIIGGLSEPSKMPWYSWSISAFECKTGSKLREVEGSVCSKCYACTHCYLFDSTKKAMARRLEALKYPRFVEAFIIVLKTKYLNGRSYYSDPVLGCIKENRFRWHDSGDLQSVEHLKMINDIALGTPEIKHWLPTREYGMVNEFLKSNSFSPNLTVRMSAVMIGEGIVKRPMDLPFSTVGVLDEKMHQCPAYSQGHKCKDCQTCWNKERDVNYPLH